MNSFLSHPTPCRCQALHAPLSTPASVTSYRRHHRNSKFEFEVSSGSGHFEMFSPLCRFRWTRPAWMHCNRGNQDGNYKTRWIEKMIENEHADDDVRLRKTKPFFFAIETTIESQHRLRTKSTQNIAKGNLFEAQPPSLHNSL